MLLRDGVCVSLGPVAEPYLRAFPPPQLFFRLVFDPKLTIAEVYMLSYPYLSWQMVLLADPLYRPGLALNPDYAARKVAEDARRRGRRRTRVLQAPDNAADSVRLRAPCGFNCLRYNPG